jgi:hypothetical protein
MSIFNGHKKSKLPTMCGIFHPAIRSLTLVLLLSENCLKPNCTIYLLILCCQQYPSGSAGYCRVRVALLYVYCVVICSCMPLVFFWSLHCLSFFRFTDSDFTIGIFKQYYGLVLLYVSCASLYSILVGI